MNERVYLCVSCSNLLCLETFSLTTDPLLIHSHRSFGREHTYILHVVFVELQYQLLLRFAPLPFKHTLTCVDANWQTTRHYSSLSACSILSPLFFNVFHSLIHLHTHIHIVVHALVCESCSFARECHPKTNKAAYNNAKCIHYTSAQNDAWHARLR